jgi:predicted  nucleic acid-binding Zn-ribbon protein
MNTVTPEDTATAETPVVGVEQTIAQFQSRYEDIKQRVNVIGTEVRNIRQDQNLSAAQGVMGTKTEEVAKLAEEIKFLTQDLVDFKDLYVSPEDMSKREAFLADLRTKILKYVDDAFNPTRGTYAESSMLATAYEVMAKSI